MQTSQNKQQKKGFKNSMNSDETQRSKELECLFLVIFYL